MNTKPIIFFAASIAAFALGGCTRETTSSANIKTPGIAASVDVTSNDGKSSTVHAILQVGGPDGTYVILDSGDKLTATAGTDSKTMEATESGEYEAEFSTAAAGTEFTVALDRATETDAPNSRGAMPAPFTVTGVPTDSASRANDETVLAWDTTDTNAKMTISIDGSCIFNLSKDIGAADGMFTIHKGNLASTNDSMPESCDVEATITRTITGTADSAYDSESSFELHQVRKVKWTSKP